MHGRAQRQIMLDITGVVMNRLLYRIGQLPGMGKYLRHLMPKQIFAAHVKQVFCCRIDVNDTRLSIQQDDRCGEMFKGKIRKFEHTFMQSRIHARKMGLLEFGQLGFQRFDVSLMQIDLLVQ